MENSNTVQNRLKTVQNLLFFTVVSYIGRNPNRVPLMLLAAAILPASMAAAGCYLSANHYAAGEIFTSLLINSFLFCGTLVAAGMGLIFARGVYNSLRYTGPDLEGETVDVPQLPAQTQWPVPNIAPDKMICQRPGETLTEFAARADAARVNASASVWFPVITFQEPEAVVYTGGRQDSFVFPRELPPFAEHDFPADWLPVGENWQTETWDNYRHYCDWFAGHFRKWASGAKLSADKENAPDNYIKMLKAKAISVACFLLLFSVGLSAQTKTEQVVSAFGGTGGVPEDGSEIVYDFGRNEYKRIADGRRNYVELLNIPGFDNSEGGRLIAVWNGTRRVARAIDVERVNARPASKAEQMRPASVIVPTEQQLSQLAMPDSSEVEESIRQAFDYRKTEVWRAVSPYWKMVMWFFWSLLPIPIFFILVLRYYARTARQERFYGLSWVGRVIHTVHESCSGYTLLICWGLASFLFVDLFMVFVYWGLSLWGWLVTVFPLFWMAEKLTNWITPNPPAAMQVEQGSVRSYYPASR